jgi:hypothetical protein
MEYKGEEMEQLETPISLASKLQAAEARAVAAETLADEAIHRVTLLLDLAYDAAKLAKGVCVIPSDWHERHSDIRTWAESPHLHLDSARELIEKAKQHDEMEQRIEELETGYLEDAEEFDKDCWKAIRSLLNLCEWDWSQDPEATADDSREHVALTITDLRNRNKRLADEAGTLRTRLAESEALVGQLKDRLKYMHGQCEEHLLGYMYSDEEAANEALLALTPADALQGYRDVVLEGVAKQADEKANTAKSWRDKCTVAGTLEIAGQHHAAYKAMLLFAEEIRAMKAPKKGGK